MVSSAAMNCLTGAPYDVYSQTCEGSPAGAVQPPHSSMSVRVPVMARTKAQVKGTRSGSRSWRAQRSYIG
jgi:hypothetical protein